MTLRHQAARAALVACMLVSTGAGLAHEHASMDMAMPAAAVSDLGSIAFPTSTASPQAQAAFVRGALLLHLFEYEQAADAFRDAQRLDPSFAMAYWGEAMTHNHGIWNEVDEEAGRAALAKLAPTPDARAAKAPTAREKDYLAAVQLLYSGTGTKQARDARYDQAMAAMARRYPDDSNAQLFHALALMGRSEGVRDVRAYLEAGTIARRVFDANPQDPGAAHYWIHSMDDPGHAAAALVPARALAKISPGAGHAQHMTSHIFMALGMWDDVTAANEAAMRVVNAERAKEGRLQSYCGHYNEWLEYAELQQGRTRAAMQVLHGCAASVAPAKAWAAKHVAQVAALGTTPAGVTQGLNASLLQMRAMALLDAANAGEAGSIRIDTTGLGTSVGWNDLIDGLVAVERGNLLQAQAALAALGTLRADQAARKDADAQATAYLGIMQDELDGLVRIRQGKVDAGLDLLRRAATRYDAVPFDFGPPVPIKPPHELLGEQLLARGDATGAREAFEGALKGAPRRLQSVLGLARAQAASGDTAAALATYASLAEMLHGADAGFPALQEARTFIATHAPKQALPAAT